MLCHATLPHDRLCNITRSPAWAERGVDQILLTLHMGVTAKMFLVFFLLVVFTLTFTGSDKIMNISVHMTFDYIYFIKAALGLSPQPNLLQHRYCYFHQVSNPGSAAWLAIWRVRRHKYCFILMFVNAIREWHNDVQPNSCCQVVNVTLEVSWPTRKYFVLRSGKSSAWRCRIGSYHLWWFHVAIRIGLATNIWIFF